MSSAPELTRRRDVDAVLALQKIEYADRKTRGWFLMDPQQRLDTAERMLREIEPASELYDYQKLVILALNDFRIRRLIANKSRQIGYTTGAACIPTAIDMLAFPRFLCVHLSIKEEHAIDMLTRTAAAIGSIGATVREEVLERDTAKALVTSHGAKVIAVTKKPHNLRSLTLNRINLDEFGFAEEDKGIMQAAIPASQRKGAIIMLSNPNAERKGTVFESTWIAREKLGYWSDEIPVHDCPHMSDPATLDRLKEECAMLGLSFEAEYECSFAGNSDASPIKWDLLMRAKTHGIVEDGARVLGWDPGFKKHGSAIVVLEIDRARVKEAVHIEVLSGRKQTMPYPAQVRRIREVVRRFGVRRVYVDGWSEGDPLADFLGPIAEKVRKVKMRPPAKTATARYIAFELDRGRFFIRYGEHADRLCRDLSNYNAAKGTWPETSDGHGDVGMALFLAWQAVPRKPVVQPTRDITREMHGFGQRESNIPAGALR